MIKNNFKLDELSIQKYKDDGFVILRDFLSEETTDCLRELSKQNNETPIGNYGSGFNKLKYDVGNDDENILNLIQNKIFNTTLNKLTERKLIYTQGLSFELEKEKSTGFPWHVGTQSFGFQQKEDYGCTLWAPLCEINPNKQRGGMAYVSKRHLSGDFIYQHINLIPEYLKEIDKDVDFSFFSKVKNNVLNQPEMSDLLTHYAEEDFFSVGDVIIFDKSVIHRSVKLGEGDISIRSAFALRFADIHSKYDAFRAEQLEYPKHAFNYQGSSNFNIEVCGKDGQNIIDSHFYKNDLQQRMINECR